jgi:hypothetical protein
MVRESDWDLLMRLRSVAAELDRCVNEFGDDIKACSACFQALHDAVYASRHIHPQLLGYRADDEG